MAQDDKYELPDQQELITDQQKLEEAKKGPAVQCPYCGVLNSGGTQMCVNCGGDIQAGLAKQAGGVLGAFKDEAVPDKPCPNCGQPVKANAQRCPNCGGSLVGPIEPPAPPEKARKTPMGLIIGLIVFGVLCLVGIIALIILSNRTSDTTAVVSALHWKYAIEILELQPVSKSAWSEEVPSDARDVSCRDEYKETSSNPAPNATEVCGTPYTVDTGGGAGKVVQDCVYEIYASYCDYTVEEWVVVSTALAEGTDKNPQWPVLSLSTGQQEGERNEQYQVTFTADGETYTYSPGDFSEYSQFDVGSEWILSINTFGAIKELREK
jgi:hypothetical protein